MIKVFTYFVEPASYTVDLILNVHKRLNIEYAFIKDKSEAISTDSLESMMFLSNKSIFAKLYFLYRTWKDHDIIIVNGYNNYPFIITFVINILSFSRRYIAIESDTQCKVPKNIIKRIIKKIYLNIIFRNKYILGFAGGSVTHKDLFRYYGMTEDRIFLIPMMIDNKKYYQNIKRFPDKFTFLFVGRLLKTKNVDSLCKIFISSFLEKDAQLVIVGGGKDLYFYKQKYSCDKIKFKGSLFGKALIDIYQNSSVFVFPSSKEAWGLVINEAMSAALPVIAHREVGAVHDLILKRDTGFIIRNNNELEARMLQMYIDNDLCQKQSRKAINLMRTYWNYSLYETNLLEVINKVKKWRLVQK